MSSHVHLVLAGLTGEERPKDPEDVDHHNLGVAMPWMCYVIVTLEEVPGVPLRFGPSAVSCRAVAWKAERRLRVPLLISKRCLEHGDERLNDLE